MKLDLSGEQHILSRVQTLHEEIRSSIVKVIGNSSFESLTRAMGYGAGDFTYPLDIDAEKIVRRFVGEWAAEYPIALITEEGGLEILPSGTPPEKVELYVIVDPIDGTRNLMYDLRSAWILTGVAPVTSPDQTPALDFEGHLVSRMNLSDITISVQSEIPTAKQCWVDNMWAFRGKGAHMQRCNIESNTCTKEMPFESSHAVNIDDGFFIISKFFPEGKDILSRVELEVVNQITGSTNISRVFEDQYICSAGQLYFIATGRYRFAADLRPWLSKVMDKKIICARPYDLCTALICQETGVEITDLHGNSLDAPLNATSDVGFVAYANKDLRAIIEPKLMGALLKNI